MENILETAIGLVIILGFVVVIVSWISRLRPKAPLERDAEGRVKILGSDVDFDVLEQANEQNAALESWNGRRISGTRNSAADIAVEIAKNRMKRRGKRKPHRK